MAVSACSAIAPQSYCWACSTGDVGGHVPISATPSVSVSTSAVRSTQRPASPITSLAAESGWSTAITVQSVAIASTYVRPNPPRVLGDANTFADTFAREHRRTSEEIIEPAAAFDDVYVWIRSDLLAIGDSIMFVGVDNCPVKNQEVISKNVPRNHRFTMIIKNRFHNPSAGSELKRH